MRTDPDVEDLADAFRRRVFGADELLSALDDAGSITGESAFDRLRPAIPEWERDHHTDWEGEWQGRTRRLLAWSVEFGLATRDGDEYVVDDTW